MKIVHITPHLGGGVGRVLLSWIERACSSKTEKHSIISLEYANAKAVEWAKKNAIPLSDRLAGNCEAISRLVKEADIVLIHWWNHPLLYNFIVNESIPECRLILWSHVSGHTAPYIFTQAIIDYADMFVISTPYSFDAPAVTALSPEQKKSHIRLVFTSAGTERVSSVKPVEHEGFNIGYIGTVDYCKLHPSFIRMSVAAQIPEVKFIVCGGEQQQKINDEARKVNVEDKFEFTGPVDDIGYYLSRFDVFAYPLRAGHYGTGEQALIEAMAAGLPVVVFNHGCERALVEHGRTGLIVDTEEEYSAALELLYRDVHLRNKIAHQAREAALERFSIDNMVSCWNSVFDELISKPKLEHCWKTSIRLSGARLYVESLGTASGPFNISLSGDDDELILDAEKAISALNGAFRSQTRGSTFHYRSIFKNDAYLNLWCGLIEMSMEKYADALVSFNASECIGHWRTKLYTVQALESLNRFDEAMECKKILDIAKPGFAAGHLISERRLPCA